MLSLNMVIIASMIGAGGLGFDVLNALRRLDFGAGLEAGLAIVALAIALDRLSQAVAHRGYRAPPAGRPASQAPLPCRSPRDGCRDLCRGSGAALGADLSARGAAFHQRLLGGGGGMDQRHLLRHVRGDQERHPHLASGPGEAVSGRHALAGGRGPSGPCRLAAGGLAAGGCSARGSRFSSPPPGFGKRR